MTQNPQDATRPLRSLIFRPKHILNSLLLFVTIILFTILMICLLLASPLSEFDLLEAVIGIFVVVMSSAFGWLLRPYLVSFIEHSTFGHWIILVSLIVAIGIMSGILLIDDISPCCFNEPTPTPAIRVVPIETVARECREGAFSGGTNSIVSAGLGCTAPGISLSGVHIGWSVVQPGSFAGCNINLPTTLETSTVDVSDYRYLQLQVRGNRGGESFGVTLVDVDSEHRELAQATQSLSDDTPATITLFLSKFSEAGVDLQNLQLLSLGFDYALGENSRDSGICVSEIAFTTE
jgi:hypothetical protein